MDYENEICQAIDLMADDRHQESCRLLESCINRIKKQLQAGKSQCENYYYWGMCLSIMDEHQQALLKFESAVRLNPNHQASLWQIAGILLYTLDKPKSALRILEDALLPLVPENKEYQRALSDAKSMIRIMRDPPPHERPPLNGKKS